MFRMQVNVAIWSYMTHICLCLDSVNSMESDIFNCDLGHFHMVLNTKGEGQRELISITVTPWG